MPVNYVTYQAGKYVNKTFGKITYLSQKKR
jgi:hypothetical protein